MGCHFLLQCIKVKSESEVAQSCPSLSDPMDCSPPGSSVHGIFQARVLEWDAVHEQIHSNPTYNLSLGKAQEEVSHPRTSDNKKKCPGKRLPAYLPFSFLSNSLSLAEVPFNHSHSQGGQKAPECHLEELTFLVPTPCASVSLSRR